MTRVVVAMSGGVDSSVAAALLKEQGYDVIGMMLRLWSEPESEDGLEHVAENKCCSLESVTDARCVADRLGIPFYLVNVAEQFRQTVVDYFYDEYAAGRTPNPCLTCNRAIRFTVLLERARALDADFLATGHYVRLADDPTTGLRGLRRGVDDAKDQSYVLHVLTQDQLRRAIFPLGELTKPHVRELAAERGLAVATKAESQEICFVARDDYRGFLRRYAATRGDAAPAAGPILTQAGQRLGEHHGLAHYTIGQRKGLGVTSPEPLHVVALDAARNAVIVGPASALQRDTLTVHSVNYPSGVIPSAPFAAAVRVRYKAAEIPAIVTPLPDGRAAIQLREPVRSVTPGQAAVAYGGATGDVVLCGGIIEG